MAATDLLTLGEARDALRLPTSDTSRDATLEQTYIPAMTPVVEDVIGPVVSRSVTVTADGGEGAILLPSAASSVTSVVELGVTLVAGTDYVADLANGILHRGSTSGRAFFARGVGSVVVTYLAGTYADTAAVPSNVKLAARIILAAQWTGSDQQGARPEFGGGGEADTVRTPSGHFIPREAYELLEPDADDYLGFA